MPYKDKHSPAAIASRRRGERKYQRSAKGRAKNNARRNAWHATPEGKAYRSIYGKTPRVKFSAYKAGAKSREVVFELTFDQFVAMWQKPCYYCGCAIKTIGVDRLDNAKGYTAENCRPCCTVHNIAKGEMSPEDFVRSCAGVVKHVAAHVDGFKGFLKLGQVIEI